LKSSNVFPTNKLTEAEGMTLLDYFAGQVVIGLLSSSPCFSLNDKAELARGAYQIADVMLTEGAKHV